MLRALYWQVLSISTEALQLKSSQNCSKALVRHTPAASFRFALRAFNRVRPEELPGSLRRCLGTRTRCRGGSWYRELVLHPGQCRAGTETL